MTRPKKELPKQVVACPRCHGKTELAQDAFYWLFLAYRPYVCTHCECRFRPGGSVRPVYFLLGVTMLVAAWFFPQLKAATEQDPNVEIYALATVFVVTILTALVLRMDRRTCVVRGNDSLDRVLHYLSHWIMPLGLVVFGIVAFTTPG